MRKKIAATELVKIIIVAHQGDTRVNIICKFDPIAPRTTDCFFAAFLTLNLLFCYYL